MPTINDRFTAFCRQFPGAEAIDLLTLTPEEEQRRLAGNLKRADFFFEGRSIICELKALETDTSDKLKDALSEKGVTPEDLAKGIHIVEQLLGKKIYHQTNKALTTPITNLFTKAVNQVKDSKTLFDLPNAHGLLIVVNDTVPILGGPQAYERFYHRLLNKGGQVEIFHKHINRFLYVGETHVMEMADGADQFISITLPNPYAPGPQALEDFVFALIKAWAEYSCRTFSKGGDEVEERLKNSKLYLEVK